MIIYSNCLNARSELMEFEWHPLKIASIKLSLTSFPFSMPLASSSLSSPHLCSFRPTINLPVFESALLIQAGRLGYYPAMITIATLYPPQNRPSHYRPWRDTGIVEWVAWSLLKRGLYPLGLLRALRLVAVPVRNTPKNDG